MSLIDWTFSARTVSRQSINPLQLETGDGDDVGCTCDIENLGSFGTDVTVGAGKERDQQQCLQLKHVTYRYSAVEILETGCEKPNSPIPSRISKVPASTK